MRDTNSIVKTKYMLTLWVEDISQSDFYSAIVQFPLDKLVIGGIEKTETNKEHYHVYLKSKKGIHFDAIKRISSTCHIEQVFSTEIACYNYCIKEGLFYSNFVPQLDTETIENDLINDMYNGYTIKQIILKYPKYAIYHFENIRKIYEVLKDK